MSKDRLAESDREKFFVAIHEAGHALAYLLAGLPIRNASVVPEPGTLGRVSPKQVKEEEPEIHLVLGWSPRTRQGVHDQIIVSLAGDAAERRARAEVGAIETGYFGDSHDYANARDLAMVASGSTEEAVALFSWLQRRTEDIVRGFYYRKMEDKIVPALLEEGDLSQDEIIELLRPIAADVLDISPKTWRRRLRLRLLRMARPFGRAFRRATRRIRWRRSKLDAGS